MNKDTLRQVAVLLSFGAVVVVNALAVALPLNGQDTGAIADRFQVYFVPAAYVFSIWSLIYLLLLGYSIYQVLPAQRESPPLRSIGYLFVLSCAANIAWIFLWHHLRFPESLIAMAVLLVSLIAIYLRLDIGRTAVEASDRWLVHLSFSVYLGWITVASIANVTSVLYYWQWGGWGISPEAWAVIMLWVAVMIAAVVAVRRRDVAYQLVLAWAFAGIAVKHADVGIVANAAWAATAAVALLAIASLVWRRSRPWPSATG